MNRLVSVSVSGHSGLTWSIIVLRVALAGFFLFMAFKNLSGDPKMAADFARWGYPVWFRMFTAVLQAAGALLLLVAPLTFYGAALLSCILVGAMFTHLRHDPVPTVLAPAVFIIFTLVISILSRPPLLRRDLNVPFGGHAGP